MSFCKSYNDINMRFSSFRRSDRVCNAAPGPWSTLARYILWQSGIIERSDDMLEMNGCEMYVEWQCIAYWRCGKALCELMVSGLSTVAELFVFQYFKRSTNIM